MGVFIAARQARWAVVDCPVGRASQICHRCCKQPLAWEGTKAQRCLSSRARGCAIFICLLWYTMVYIPAM